MGIGPNPQELNNIISLNENFQNFYYVIIMMIKRNTQIVKIKQKKIIAKSIKDISNILILYINRIEGLSNKRISNII